MADMRNGPKGQGQNIIPFVKPAESRGDMSAAERLNMFIQNNRRGLIIGGAGVLVVIVACVIGISIKHTLDSQAIAESEDLSRRYDVLTTSAGGAPAPITDPAKAPYVQALITDLAAFAHGRTGYAGARGYQLLGQVYATQKDWANAQTAWTSGAQAAGATYLAPVLFFNAAIAAEEQGHISDAIDLYTACVARGDRYPGAPRAQFMIGRLQEAQHNQDAALDAYKTLLQKWPSDAGDTSHQSWTNLARSRILFITTVGLDAAPAPAPAPAAPAPATPAPAPATPAPAPAAGTPAGTP